MMTIVAEDDRKVKDPSRGDLRPKSERVLRAQPHDSPIGIALGRVGGPVANSGLENAIPTAVEPSMVRGLPVCLTILPSPSCLGGPLEVVQPIFVPPRLPNPAASAWSPGEIFGLGLLGGASLLAVGYGLLSGIGFTGNWALFQAGIERLVQ